MEATTIARPSPFVAVVVPALAGRCFTPGWPLESISIMHSLLDVKAMLA
jgi:hypothetical protein